MPLNEGEYKEKQEKENFLEKLIEKFCAIGLRKTLGKFNVICPGGKAEDQIAALRLIRKCHPHSIELWKNIPEGPSDFRESNDNTQFNCFMFCLDINYGDIKKLIGKDGTRILNHEYMALLEKKYLTIKDSGTTVDGDHIFYFSDSKIMHAGKIKGGRVISKWGGGHIWMHGIFEVPESYGDQVQYYESTEKSLYLKAFCEWIK
jgi:hypothetical protein